MGSLLYAALSIWLVFLSSSEVSHIYQKKQIEKLLKWKQNRWARDLIESWVDSYRNYHRNEGHDTFKNYICQPVEVDTDDGIGQAKISPELDILETARLKEIALRFGVVVEWWWLLIKRGFQ